MPNQEWGGNSAREPTFSGLGRLKAFQNQDFTQPGVVTGTGHNPFFGLYQFAVPANIVVSSYSVNKPGVDVGAGVAFGSKWGGKFFAEARYNWIFTGTYYTEYLPVTFGYRK